MKKKNSILELAGIFEDDEEIKEAIEEGRKRSRDRSDRIVDKLDL